MWSITVMRVAQGQMLDVQYEAVQWQLSGLFQLWILAILTYDRQSTTSGHSRLRGLVKCIHSFMAKTQYQITQILRLYSKMIVSTAAHPSASHSQRM